VRRQQVVPDFTTSIYPMLQHLDAELETRPLPEPPIYILLDRGSGALWK
jgi:hypothetical protein